MSITLEFLMEAYMILLVSLGILLLIGIMLFGTISLIQYMRKELEK